MIIDRIENYENGWFVGDFIPSIIKNKDFEVGYKKHKKEEKYSKHYHKETIEINLLTKGEMIIQGKRLTAGDIFIIYPYEISDPDFITDCEVMIVRYPSIPTDKTIINE